MRQLKYWLVKLAFLLYGILNSFIISTQTNENTNTKQDIYPVKHQLDTNSNV